MLYKTTLAWKQIKTEYVVLMRNKDIFSMKFKLPPLRTKDIQGRSQGVSSMSRDPLFVKGNW